MPQSILSPSPLTQVAVQMAPRTLRLAAAGAAFLLMAWILPFPTAAFAFVLLGVTFLALGMMIYVVARNDRKRAGALFETVSCFVENDAAPNFSTDVDGMVIYQNTAATSDFGDQIGESLASAFKDMFAAPAAVIYRLQNKAQALGAACEEMVLRRGHIRVSVHLVGEKGYLWRLDELRDRGPAGRTGENISLPMMTASKNNTILFMNEAARRVLGGRETTLDRVFTELPVRPGSVSMVSGKDGPVPALICELDISAGRKEIYLLPPPAGPTLTTEEWGVIDGLPVPLLKLDSSGLITMANRRARALLQDEDAIGTRLADQVEGLGRPVSEWLREAHAGRHLGRTEVVRATTPEEDVFVQISLEQVVEEQGTVLVAVLQDATELKSLEAQFVQSQKMEAIGQLAGGVAHDFNNLLTAISGHCDLLLMGRDDTDPEFSDLTQIHQNANRAAALVRQLLAFSRKQTLRPEVLDLSESLSDLTHLLNRLVGEKVTLELEHDTEILPIRADRRQLDQVLMNLVVNARDAMEDGGAIRVETRNVILESALKRDRATVPSGEYVVIRVIDHGIGIPQDKVRKIFEPFFTTKQAGQGTGLGLSMAYGIVKQMGGFIFVDSIPRAGSTFSLYFPVVTAFEEREVGAQTKISRLDENNLGSECIVKSADRVPENDGKFLASSQFALELPDSSTNDEPEDPVDNSEADGPPVLFRAEAKPMLHPESAAEAPTPTHEAGKREDGIVLLVEDEAPVRAFASRALRMRGYTVLEADCAEDALKTLEDTSLKIDVFVTDVVMPGMDGPTWVSKALEDRPGVKVVFVSGYAEDSVAEHQARIPNSVFLPKPFSLTDLTATVQGQLH